MFEITQSAAEQVLTAARQGGTEGMALRMAARQKADGTFDYLMGFDDIKEDDIRLNSCGVEIVMSPEYVPLLDETVMDFVEMEDGDQKFIFLNPMDANYSPATNA